MENTHSQVIDPASLYEDTSENTPIILKLGGSNISYNGQIVDYNYLRELRDLIQERVAAGERFILIVGGGEKCREYMDFSRNQGGVNDEESIHWIGTAYNTLNAYLVHAFFPRDIVEEKVWKFDDIDTLADQKFDKSVVITGGFRAGASSDWVALQVAKAWKANKIIDLKNIDGVYEADPKKNPKAKKIDKLNWEEYIQIIDGKSIHKPGDNLPVDAVAAREANDHNIRYDILKGNDFASIENSIMNLEFSGTIISN